MMFKYQMTMRYSCWLTHCNFSYYHHIQFNHQCIYHFIHCCQSCSSPINDSIPSPLPCMTLTAGPSIKSIIYTLILIMSIDQQYFCFHWSWIMPIAHPTVMPIVQPSMTPITYPSFTPPISYIKVSQWSFHDVQIQNVYEYSSIDHAHRTSGMPVSHQCIDFHWSCHASISSFLSVTSR